MKRKPPKPDAKGRRVASLGHVRLYHWMMRSKAWQHLSLPGRALLVELYSLYNGINNGEIPLAVREAARRLGIGKNTATKLFHDLQELGFIRPNQRGNFDWKKRHATTWVLTEFEFAGQLATKDFMRWPPENAKAGPSGRDRRSLQGGHEASSTQLAVPRSGTVDADCAYATVPE